MPDADELQARRLIGVSAEAALVDVRRRFREQLRAVHPDVNPGPDAQRRTRELIEAFRLVKARVEEDATRPAPSVVVEEAPEPEEVPFAELVDDETLAVAAPAEETFAALVAVGHAIGAVTYLDRDATLLEVLLKTVGGDTISLVITLQGRANGTTEAFLTLEPLDVRVRELPTVRGVATLVASHLNERARFGPPPSRR